MTRKPNTRTLSQAVDRIVDRMQEYERLKERYPKGTQERYLCEGKAFGLFQALAVIWGDE